MQTGDQVDGRQRAGVTGDQAPPHGPLTSVASHRCDLNLAHADVPFKASPGEHTRAARDATNAPFAALEAANGTFVPFWPGVRPRRAAPRGSSR